MNKDILQWPSGKLNFSDGCLIMGILNVTEDSFSDGGEFINPDVAVEHGIKMAEAGAAIIDIGAESTRPGSKPIDAAEQIKRICPTIKQLTQKTDIPISIDAYNYEVATAALDAGASVVNDITALVDEKMSKLVAERNVPVILMHMQGTPETMQKNPTYDDVVSEVLEFLLTRAKQAESAGVKKDMIFIDPGIGFGKTTEHNLLLLKNIDKFTASGYRVLLGASRKRFIGEITGKDKPEDRILGTAATTALAVAMGVSIVRVHDVSEMVDVVKVANAICR